MSPEGKSSGARGGTGPRHRESEGWREKREEMKGKVESVMKTENCYVTLHSEFTFDNTQVMWFREVNP